MTPILLNSYLDKHILVYPMRTDSLTYVHGPCVPYAYYVHSPCVPYAYYVHGPCVPYAYYVHGPCVPYAYYVQNPVFHSSLFNVRLVIDILLNVGDMCDLNTGDGN